MVFVVGVMASGLGRLKKIASAYPKLFEEVFEYSQNGKPALAVLDMLAAVQQKFNSGQSTGQYPKSFVEDATVIGRGLPSVAAIERTLRDKEPAKYLNILSRAGLSELDKQAMLAQEKRLVEAGYLKDAKRLWKKLPADTRTNLAAIGITGAKPWDLYQPAPDNPPNAVLIRLLNWLEDTRSESERLRKSRSKEQRNVAPVVLWKLAGLEKWKPSAAALPKFVGPVGGYMSPSTIVSWVLRARSAVDKNDMGQLQAIMKKFGPHGTRWLIEQAPSLESFIKAFDPRSDKDGSLSFKRVVSLSREYWDVMPLELCECPESEMEPYLAPAAIKPFAVPAALPAGLIGPPPAPAHRGGHMPPPPPNGNGNGNGHGGGGGFPSGAEPQMAPQAAQQQIAQQQILLPAQQQAAQQQIAQQQAAIPQMAPQILQQQQVVVPKPVIPEPPVAQTKPVVTPPTAMQTLTKSVSPPTPTAPSATTPAPVSTKPAVTPSSASPTTTTPSTSPSRVTPSTAITSTAPGGTKYATADDYLKAKTLKDATSTR